MTNRTGSRAQTMAVSPADPHQRRAPRMSTETPVSNGSQTRPITPAETAAGPDAPVSFGDWLRARRGWLGVGLVAAVGGLWLGWPGLVAAGIAPVLLGVLPCVAMCALGLCMKSGTRACEPTPRQGTRTGASSGDFQQIRSDERQETDR